MHSLQRTETWDWRSQALKLTGILGLLVCFSFASADDLFTVEITVSDVTSSFGFSDVESVFDQVQKDELEAEFPAYDEMARARAAVDYRGLMINLEFADETSLLIFEVPSLDIKEMFRGADRDASIDELKDFMKNEGGKLLNRIQKALIATSPVDPIAGNPGSMMGTMVSEQFEAGFMDQTTNIAEASEAPAAAEEDYDPDPDNLLHLGARFGRLTADGKQSDIWTLPLGYSFRFKEGEGSRLRSLNLSLPLTYVDVEGATVVHAAFGIGLTYAVSKRWSLSPAIGAGAVASVDLGSAGGVSSLSLTSAYTIPRKKWSLNVGNMIGYYETLDFKVEGYDFDPGISNTVLRNGLMVSIPSTMGGRDVATEFWVSDTRFFGSELYSEYYDEFGVSFGLAKTRDAKPSIENYLRLGFSYQTGDGIEGWRFNLGYSF